MLWKSSMLLAGMYLLYFGDEEDEMSRGKAGKIVRVFRDVGIIFVSIGSIISVVKELASIPWGEWVSSGVVSHLLELLKWIIVFPLGILLMSVLNAFAMYCLHKLWPDDYDEWGHHQKGLESLRNKEIIPRSRKKERDIFIVRWRTAPECAPIP